MTTTMAIIRSMRPPFLILTPVCILLGIAAASASGMAINTDLALLVLIGAVSAHISANTFNEYFDFANGLDEITKKTPFSGGSGALPENPTAHNLVLAAAVVSLLITITIGNYIVSLKGPFLFALGIIGVITIIVYSRWIHRSAWLCLIAPGFAFGPLFVVGTFISVVDADSIRTAHILKAFIFSLVPFFLVNNLLLLNQFPDIDADKQVGRKTFPIQHGKRASIKMYLTFILLTALTILMTVVFYKTPWISLFALLPLTMGFAVYSGAIKVDFVIEKMIPYMGKNVALILLTIFAYASLIMIGMKL